MRGVVKFLLSFVVGIAIIWFGFWWYAGHRLQSGFQAWAEQQATSGWKVSYDSLRNGTSPMNAEVIVTNLVLTPPPGPSGETIAIALPSVTLRIAALDPLVFHTDLPATIGITIANNVGLTINSGSIALSENLDPDALFKPKAYPFRGGDFAAGNVQILASSLLVLHIDSITSHADVNLQAGATGTALTSTTVLNGLALSPLLTRIASVPFDGKLARLSISNMFSGPVPEGIPAAFAQLNAVPRDRVAQQKLLVPLLHQWASDGGHGNVAMQLILGPSTITGDASLKFDANLQPAGSADLNADRLGRLTTALTDAYPALQDDVARAEAQFSPYITNTDQGGQTLGVHVVYGAGGVTINGQKTTAMPQLDWAALENPVPPATPAPGDGSGAASPNQ